MSVDTVDTVETGVEAEPLLPAPQVDLRKAAQFGLWCGLATVFVSAIGMVEAFSEKEVLTDLSLGTALLLAIPFGLGFAAAKAPRHREGFEEAKPGGRNVAAGFLVGVLSAAIMAFFVVLIVNFDVRDPFINITPALAENEEGPRLLLYGQSVGAGIGLIFGLTIGAALIGGSIHLLGERHRRACLSGLLWVVFFALLSSFIGDLLRGLRRELRVETDPLVEFLYSRGALRIAPAVLIAVAGFAGHLYRERSDRKPLKARYDSMDRQGQIRLLITAAPLVLVVIYFVPQVLGQSLAHVLGLAGIYVLMALGLNIVIGYAGMLDLGYVAFFAVGAYTTGVLTAPGDQGFGWNYWASVPVVIVAATLAGLIVGTPVLRMRGDYLAIVTLGFGEITRLLFLSDWLTPTFGGAQGITRIPNIVFGPIEIKGTQAFLYPLFGLIVLAAYVSYALQNSRIGRAWMAMREDESVAEAIGVNIVTAKLAAFVVGAILAGLGGSLFSTTIGTIFPSSFEILVSITVLVVVIVGGMASIRGVMLGAIVLVGLPELLREFEDFRFIIYGALLIGMMLMRPEGFIPSRRRAQELHEADVEQDAWLRARVADTGNGS